MIEVRLPLEIQIDSQGGWQLMFFVLDAFNYSTPFRGMLANIADALGQDPKSDIQLPVYKSGEDFVDGVLRFGEAPLRVYDEHALSYLTLTSDDERILRDVAFRIETRVALI